MLLFEECGSTKILKIRSILRYEGLLRSLTTEIIKDQLIEYCRQDENASEEMTVFILSRSNAELPAQELPNTCSL